MTLSQSSLSGKTILEDLFRRQFFGIFNFPARSVSLWNSRFSINPLCRRSRQINCSDPRERHLLGFARPVNNLPCIEDFKTNRGAIFAEIHYDDWPQIIALADSCLVKRDGERVGMRIVFDFHGFFPSRYFFRFEG